MAEGGLSAPEYSTNYQPTKRNYPMLPEVPEGEVLGDWTLPENPTAEQMLQAFFKHRGNQSYQVQKSLSKDINKLDRFIQSCQTRTDLSPTTMAQSDM